MILVLLGTQNNSFHRLLKEIQKCIDKKIINEKVIVQAGTTKFESNDMEILDFFEQDKIDEMMKQANFIITHGGVGTIVNAVKMGKKVVAVPRLKKYGEHVNDHQLQIIESFSNQGFIIGVNDVNELESALKKISNFKPSKLESNTQNIINIIKQFIDKV